MVSGGTRAVARGDALGVAPHSDEAGMLCRAYLTPAFAEAQQAIAGWMAEAGMATRIDAAANLIGNYAGTSDAPALIIGSHIDSVRDGGRYDGPLGVMLGIECVAALSAAGKRMPFPIEVIAFGDEEGSRFPASMLTSRAVAGVLGDGAIEVVDGDGVSLADALHAHSVRFERSREMELGAPVGFSTSLETNGEFASAKHAPALAYLEAHIEQGPVLAAEGLPVGIVTGIAAQLRYRVTVCGTAGHAGTSPMGMRRDALTAAAEMVLAVERIAGEDASDLVATVGKLEAAPGAPNVIPGRVVFTIDVRSGDEARRDAAAEAILDEIAGISDRRDVAFAAERVNDLAASPCDPALMDMLEQAVQAEGVAARRLVSGAGHDAMVMASLCPIAMLFIRCRGGISHNPAEHVEPADAEVALSAMLGFIDRLGERV
ncbi:allantoate amidohydrolase [soil metagenome]